MPATHADPVAGRLVTWALVLLGVAEIPWVIFLAFTQDPVVRFSHVKMASLGLAGLAAVLCASSVWALTRRTTWAPALCVGAATTLTFLGALGALTPSLHTTGLLGTGELPLIAVLPGILAAVYAAAVLLTGDPGLAPPRESPAPDSRRLHAAAIVLACTAALVVARIVLHVLQWDSATTATQTRAIVVLLDAGESVGLLGAGLASLTGHARSTLVLASVACSLLICDAYGNVVMAASGEAFTSALFYLVVGEVPSIVLCALAIRAAHRTLAVTAEPGTSVNA